MATELFSVCALPLSCAEGSDVHVSLFISPKLTPTGTRGELRSFPLFRHWGAHVKDGLKLELFDQAGPIEATAILDDVDPDLWDAAFPDDTPVKGQPVPEWSHRHWRTFAARTVHDFGKAVHLATVYAGPTSPPAPGDHPLAGPLGEISGRYYRPDPHAHTSSAGSDRRHALVYDESLMTADFDRIVESGESLAVVEKQVAGEQNWLRRMALELHRTRRYYERPESAGTYRERPKPNAVSKPLPKPKPEFHERCATAGDHPALLRRLGLVIDLKVSDPKRLRKSAWLSARLSPGGDPAPCRLTRTRCRAVGNDLVTIAETPDWVDGLARLGDEDRFALLDLEADGTAIKLERFLWTLPRLQEIADNDASANAATPALRASGFTVVRVGQARDTQQRLDRQHDIESVIGHGEPPTLSTEDVTRGLRIEVWDDTAHKWQSLHSRLTTVSVLGFGTVVDELAEEGFVQGTAAHETPGVANSPVHVHEAVFGWEGWSLSAPRPGKRVRHEGGDEIVEDPPEDEPDPVHPILVVNHVRPGTLPRLRFGRSYAMRAWAVDLAGNSRPHELNPPPAPAASVSSALAPALKAQPIAADVAARLPAELRAVTHAVLESRRLGSNGSQPAAAEDVTLFASPEHEALVRTRLSDLRSSRAPLGFETVAETSRHALVEEAVATAIADRAQPFVSETAARTADELRRLVASQAAINPAGSWLEAVRRALATVTPKRPFLRWDPVPSPAVVPLRRYTEGESIRVLVVRSGVTQDPDSLEITVTPPNKYAAAVAATHPELDLGYLDRAERHLAPPKTSQVQAELHGQFDEAISSTDPADHQRLLGIALLENGSFLDLDIADIDNPPKRLPQPGVQLEMQPGTPHADPVTLPLLQPGDPPAPGKGYTLPPGQYVVHDTTDLVLPYLPDPLGRGVSFVFQEAGLDRAIPFPFGGEGFTARYPGKWPEVQPFRLVLNGAAQLGGKAGGRVITISLPAGDVQRFRLASSLDRAELDLFGPWRSLPQSVRDDPNVAEAAADGWLWGLTPFEDVTLVHAVPRPLQAPRPTLLLPLRSEGSTRVTLLGAVDLDGPSTDRLTAEATWVDPVDDVTLPLPEDRPTAGVAFTSPVVPFEDLAILSIAEGEGTLPGVGRLRAHAANHELGDTKHRLIDYRFRAATRFREYFHPDLLAPGSPGDDGQSVVGPTVSISVPSSARPAAPIVHSVIPLFRWSDGTEPEQPMARRHGRRAGVRIFLERPWYSSGAGELLAVLLAPGGDDTFGPPAEDQSGFPFVSKWGGDPAWVSAPIDQRALGLVQLDNLLRTTGFDDRPEAARPVAPAATLPLASLPEQPLVTAVGYKPQFNAERRLWYVDVALDPGPAFWPFVRLAVSRYQPASIDRCHLSPPVRCDFVQLTPERTTSVSRTDDHHVRVVVSGPIGIRSLPTRGRAPAPGSDPFADAVRANRQVVARLQRRDPAISTDLGWKTVSAVELVVRGRGQNAYEAAWVGELQSGTTIPLARPGSSASWRVDRRGVGAAPGRSSLDARGAADDGVDPGLGAAADLRRRGGSLGGLGGRSLVVGVRCSFRGKDAGSVRSGALRARPRTPHRGEQRGPTAQTLFRQALLAGTLRADPV